MEVAEAEVVVRSRRVERAAEKAAGRRQCGRSTVAGECYSWTSAIIREIYR